MVHRHSSSRSATLTPQRDDGLANNDALSDAEESDALIMTRGTKGTLDLPMEREYPPDGKQCGMVSSLVSRWESESRSQSPGQGLEPSSGARMAGSQLSRSQENGASNIEAANTPVSTSVSSAMVGRPARHFLILEDGALPGTRRLNYKMVTARWQLLVGRVKPNSPKARKVHSMANLLLENLQRDGEMIPGIDVDMSVLRRIATRLPGS